MLDTPLPTPPADAAVPAGLAPLAAVFPVRPLAANYVASPGCERVRLATIENLAQGAGCVSITGAPGTGKTLVALAALAGLRECLPHTAHLASTGLSSAELFRSIAYAFGMPRGEDTAWWPKRWLSQSLSAWHARDEGAALVLDEVQNLSASVLADVLCYREELAQAGTPLRLIVLGLSPVRALLGSTEVTPHLPSGHLALQLEALDEVGTRHLIQTRLAQCGRAGKPPFDPDALTEIHRRTAGVPGRIQRLGSRLLQTVEILGLERVDARTVRTQADELGLHVPDEERVSKAPSGRDTFSMSAPAHDASILAPTNPPSPKPEADGSAQISPAAACSPPMPVEERRASDALTASASASVASLSAPELECAQAVNPSPLSDRAGTSGAARGPIVASGLFNSSTLPSEPAASILRKTPTYSRLGKPSQVQGYLPTPRSAVLPLAAGALALTLLGAWVVEHWVERSDPGPALSRASDPAALANTPSIARDARPALPAPLAAPLERTPPVGLAVAKPARTDTLRPAPLPSNTAPVTPAPKRVAQAELTPARPAVLTSGRSTLGASATPAQRGIVVKVADTGHAPVRAVDSLPHVRPAGPSVAAANPRAAPSWRSSRWANP